MRLETKSKEPTSLREGDVLSYNRLTGTLSVVRTSIQRSAESRLLFADRGSPPAESFQFFRQRIYPQDVRPPTQLMAAVTGLDFIERRDEFAAAKPRATLFYGATGTKLVPGDILAIDAPTRSIILLRGNRMLNIRSKPEDEPSLFLTVETIKQPEFLVTLIEIATGLKFIKTSDAFAWKAILDGPDMS